MRRSPSLPGVLAGLLFLVAVWPAGELWAQSSQLTEAAQEMAQAWAGQGGDPVSSHLINGQVTLHLEGSVAAALPTRQAATVLREYLRVYDRAEVELVRAALVEGSRERGFAEIRWSARRAGTSQPISRTVFLGLRHEVDRWTIEEVRVLP